MYCKIYHSVRKPWSCPPTLRSRFQMSWGPYHCQETGFVPLSRTTPCRILKVCAQIPSRTWLCLSRGCKSVCKISRCHPKTKWQPPRQRPLVAKRPEQSCWFELFSDTLCATLLESITLPWTDKDDFLQSNNVQILSLTNKTPWGYSFTCTVAQRVSPCEWNDLQFGVTSQWLCAQLNLIEIEILEHWQWKFK